MVDTSDVVENALGFALGIAAVSALSVLLVTIFGGNPNASTDPASRIDALVRSVLPSDSSSDNTMRV